MPGMPGLSCYRPEEKAQPLSTHSFLLIYTVDLVRAVLSSLGVTLRLPWQGWTRGKIPKLFPFYHFPGPVLSLCTASKHRKVGVLDALKPRKACGRTRALVLNKHLGSKFHNKSHVSHFPQECEQASLPDSSGIWTWVWSDRQLNRVQETPSAHYQQF